MSEIYKGPERRNFVRLDFTAPLALKVVKQETISKLLSGYTSDVSESGLLCKVNENVQKDDLLWLSFDRATLSICEELEKRALIYQGGVVGKVVRVHGEENGSFEVGVQFITREEKDSTHIHSKMYYLQKELERHGTS